MKKQTICPSNEEFCKELRHIRKKKGLTQSQLATAAGVSRESISLLEREKFISNKLVKKVAKALDITIVKTTSVNYLITHIKTPL